MNEDSNYIHHHHHHHDRGIVCKANLREAFVIEAFALSIANKRGIIENEIIIKALIVGNIHQKW